MSCCDAFGFSSIILYMVWVNSYNLIGISFVSSWRNMKSLGASSLRRASQSLLYTKWGYSRPTLLSLSPGSGTSFGNWRSSRRPLVKLCLSRYVELQIKLLNFLCVSSTVNNYCQSTRCWLYTYIYSALLSLYKEALIAASNITP